MKIDTREFERLTAGLPPLALGAYVRLALWSYQFGPLPVSARQRATIANLHSARDIREALRALAPLLERRAAGYVLPWVERQRAASKRLAKTRATVGRLGGLARARSAPAVAAAGRGPFLVRHARPARAVATFKLLAAFCQQELFDRYAALDARQPQRPTIHDLKEKAGPMFDWSAEPDLPGRVFDAVEHQNQQQSERTRAKYEREDRAKRRPPNPVLARRIRENQRHEKWRRGEK